MYVAACTEGPKLWKLCLLWACTMQQHHKESCGPSLLFRENERLDPARKLAMGGFGQVDRPGPGALHCSFYIQAGVALGRLAPLHWWGGTGCTLHCFTSASYGPPAGGPRSPPTPFVWDSNFFKNAMSTSTGGLLGLHRGLIMPHCACQGPLAAACGGRAACGVVLASLKKYYRFAK